MEWLVANEIRLHGWVDQNPVLVWFAGLATYTAFSLVPGTSGKAIVFGWLFGFWQAVLMVDIALTLAAVISFMVARYLLRDTVNAKFKLRIDRLNEGLERDGVFYLLMMRLAHVPFTFVNYGTGTTSVPLRTFAWTTLIGILPGTMVFVFVGTRIPTLATIADKGAWELLDPFLLAVLGFAIVFPATVHWAVRYIDRRRKSKRADSVLEGGEGDSSDTAAQQPQAGPGSVGGQACSGSQVSSGRAAGGIH